MRLENLLRRRAVSSAVAALSLSCALTASAADPVPSLDLRNYNPPLDPRSSLYLEPAATPGSGNFNVGVWASYALRPIELSDARGDRLASIVEHQASLDYYANIGVGERLAVGLSLPTVVYQTGDDVSEFLPRAEPLPATVLGDASLAVKATLLAPSDLGGVGLAALGRVWAPTGSARSYVSDGSVRGELRLLAELSLLAVNFNATAGARIRGSERTLIDDGTDDFEFGHDLPWGAGVTIRPQAFGIDPLGRWRWTVEARGAVALTPSFAAAPQSPALVGASARYTVGEVSAILGAETILNDAVGNPIVRPIFGIGWAPRFEDEDGDGIADEDDECPELPEDKDGFEDADGCPDFDDDDDGVPDEDDRCPKEKEDADDFEDDDGCPDPDNDGDGVPDVTDACPNEAGPQASPRPGCPVGDADGDGIKDDVDRCPELPEDKDGHEDEDGCPDPDNDGDGIADEDDACPSVRGEPRPDSAIHGCPNPDPDGDTIEGDADRCPDQAEDHDDVDDDDGCPDASPPGTPAAEPLAKIAVQQGAPALVLRRPLRFEGGELTSDSLPVLRAIATALNQHPDAILAVGVRPANQTAEAEQEALNRAFAIVLALRTLTHRDSAAETLGWKAVRSQPGANRTGVGLLLLSPATPSAPKGP